MLVIKSVTSNKPISIAEAYSAQSSRTSYVDSATKYEKTDIIQLVHNQKHLTEETQSKLQTILLLDRRPVDSLEGKTLVIFPDCLFNIELIPGALLFTLSIYI